MLFSLAHKHKHKHKKNKHVCFSCAYACAYALMLMLMRKWEQHKTNEWVRSSYVSAYAYAYVAGVHTCLCLCYAYALVRTSLKSASCWTNLKGSKVHSTQRAFHYSLPSRALMFSPDLHTFYMHTVTTTISSKKQKKNPMIICKWPSCFRTIMSLANSLQEGHTQCGGLNFRNFW